MKKILLLSFTLLMLAVGIAYRSAGESTDSSILKPGDEIEGMILTTGAADAPPLWSFCSPPAEDNMSVSVECEVPPLPKLAIGYTFGAADQALQTLDGSDLIWELFLDDQLVDLNAFGTYDFVFPDLATSPSPVREVFRKTKVWDLVLENPTPGLHILSGLVETRANTFRWMIRFTVARTSNGSFQSRSSQ